MTQRRDAGLIGDDRLRHLSNKSPLTLDETVQAAPESNVTTAVLALQRLAGNHAVADVFGTSQRAGDRMRELALQREAQGTAAAPPPVATSSMALQLDTLWKNDVLFPLGRAGLAVDTDPMQAYKEIAGAMSHLEMLLDATPRDDPKRRDLLMLSLEVQATFLKLGDRAGLRPDLSVKALQDELREDYGNARDVGELLSGVPQPASGPDLGGTPSGKPGTASTPGDTEAGSEAPAAN